MVVSLFHFLFSNFTIQGSFVNHVMDYNSMRSANVLGTVSLLEFVCSGKPKRLVYVSTIGVISHETVAVEGKEVSVQDIKEDSGYVKTKWVSEHLISRAAEKGFQCSIVRPAMIGWEDKTG